MPFTISEMDRRGPKAGARLHSRLVRIRGLADDLARVRMDPVTARAIAEQIKVEATVIGRAFPRAKR